MPRTFISYSWTSPAHENWVLELASQLRESGVDVTLDKWDLKEGHDAVKFMESMVSDPSVEKVIIVSDQKYVEKSDSRLGGVGTESQIISSEIYNKSDQIKFVVVVAELDGDGRPYLPIYFKSRIYIDLSSEEIYSSNFDQLLRWVFDKPAFVKPTLGKIPEFLKDDSVQMPTRSRSRRCIDLLQRNQPNARHALEDYLDTLAASLVEHRLTREEPFDEKVVVSIEKFLPARNEYIEVVIAALRYGAIDLVPTLVKFFEKVIPYLSKPEHLNAWIDSDYDNFAFIIHEMFVYSTAAFIGRQAFDGAATLINTSFYVPAEAKYGRKPLRYFDIFNRYLESLERRKARLNLNRVSLHADLLCERSHTAPISFLDLKQADAVLFMRAAARALVNEGDQWIPQTLLYTYDDHAPYEIFARAQSAAFFEKIKPMLGVASVDEMRVLIDNMKSNGTPLWLPRWNYHSLPIKAITNLDLLASRK